MLSLLGRGLATAGVSESLLAGWPETVYNPPMADDIESRMRFIIEQQAQFAADIGALKEMIEAHSRQLQSLTSNVRQLVDVSLSLTHHLEETDRRLGARIEQIAEAQADSDRRLDALIDTVDKLVRRNGGAS